MEIKFKKILLKISEYIELVIALILTVALVAAVIGMFANIKDILDGTRVLNETLEYALTLVVAIEFIKMLVKNTPGSVIEVILFAVARQVIISHSGALENLIGVLGVAVIFATWKFLFVPKFLDED
ncbi:hypothetical protein B5E58_00845 [Tyzzerella sp. An114]|uniref:transporter n=1 Tax=Tyzzerella sp. An114 TaxID=1965545 RepID=UPI000B437E1F|nr:transporter [Tyzzerella sp. An114]OUQ60447.1 hypothetical protein B5E58_00845 [Tyzzerella sp. An114]